MNKNKRASQHVSKAIDDLLNELTVQERKRIENRMLLAARIDDARRAKGWSQSDFAGAMGKNPSEISKWLSGTHNFTADTLWDIEEKLEVSLIPLDEKASVVTKVAAYETAVLGNVIKPIVFNRLNVIFCLTETQATKRKSSHIYG